MNKLAKILLDGGDFLSNEEKELKSQIHKLLNEYEMLYDQFIQNKNEINATELYIYEHFSELKRQIDIHREELKIKIDVKSILNQRMNQLILFLKDLNSFFKFMNTLISFF